MNIKIRRLNEADWLAFSRIRLKALQTDPRVFGSNYEKESQLTEADWRGKLRAKDNAVFLLSDRETPIGITCVSIVRDDPTGKTALLWGSWLAPEYRGGNLSELMYRTRIEWARQRSVKKIIVSHRASNLVSKRANQKHGFVFTHKHEKSGRTANLKTKSFTN